MNYKLFFRKGNEIFEGEIMFDQDMLLSIISEDKKEAKEKELLDSLRMLLDEDISAITVSSIIKKIIDYKPENNHEEDFKNKIFKSIEYSYLVLTPSNGNKSFDDELSLLKKVSKKTNFPIILLNPFASSKDQLLINDIHLGIAQKYQKD